MHAAADGTIGRRITSPLRLARADTTVFAHWKAGCADDSCVMRMAGRRTANFMTTDGHETTPAFGEPLKLLENGKCDEAAPGRRLASELTRAEIYMRGATAWQEKGETRRA